MQLEFYDVRVPERMRLVICTPRSDSEVEFLKLILEISKINFAVLADQGVLLFFEVVNDSWMLISATQIGGKVFSRQY